MIILACMEKNIPAAILEKNGKKFKLYSTAPELSLTRSATEKELKSLPEKSRSDNNWWLNMNNKGGFQSRRHQIIRNRL